MKKIDIQQIGFMTESWNLKEANLEPPVMRPSPKYTAVQTSIRREPKALGDTPCMKVLGVLNQDRIAANDIIDMFGDSDLRKAFEDSTCSGHIDNALYPHISRFNLQEIEQLYTAINKNLSPTTA